MITPKIPVLNVNLENRVCANRMSMEKELEIGYGSHNGFYYFGCKECDGFNRYCLAYMPYKNGGKYEKK